MRDISSIGFIGLGHMGYHMVNNLAKAGKQVYVYDVMPEAMARFQGVPNVEAVSAASELADKVKTVVLMLPNSPHVETALFGEGGVLSEKVPEDYFVIDMSSISPDVTRDIAKKLAEKNVKFVEGPVSGGVSGAENGALTIMCGGKKEYVDEIMEVFEILGKKIVYCGESGSGQAVKVVNQLMSAINLISMSEAFVLGTKFGVDPNIMRDVIVAGSGRCWALEDRMPEILKGNFQPGFAIDLHTKDVKLAVDMAKNMNLPLYATNLVCELFKTAQVKGYGKLDNCAIIKLYEELGSVEVRG